MLRSVALDKVRKLLFKAVHKNTPIEERKTARSIADKIMSEHNISEMEVWSKTTIDDIPPGIQDSITDDLYATLNKFVTSLEEGQEKAILKATEKAEKYVQDNKEKIKDKVGYWLDGLFK